jgi:hypothetical protein
MVYYGANDIQDTDSMIRVHDHEVESMFIKLCVLIIAINIIVSLTLLDHKFY